MKVLIMVHSLTGGGAERVAALWATGFIERGHEVRIVLNCPTNTPQTYSVPKTVVQYNMKNWLAGKIQRHFKLDYWYVVQVKKVIDDFEPDVIICVLGAWAEWCRKALTKKKIPIINTEHNSFEWPDNSPMPKDIWVRKFEQNRRFNHVTVLTEVDKEYVKGVLDNVSVLPNPLAFQPVSSIPQKKKIILAAGRIDAWHVKGFDLLIKAWGKIAKQYPDWKLQIAGNSKSGGKSYIQKIADDAGLGEQLDLLGYQSDMLPIYQRASIFVLSSRYEGFGMVLIEAMSQGCAPIACDYEGRQQEIITSEKEGVICPVEDVDALSKAIHKLIEDDDYRNSIQKKAVERSRFYSLDNTMDRWEDIIKRIKVSENL